MTFLRCLFWEGNRKNVRAAVLFLLADPHPCEFQSATGTALPLIVQEDSEYGLSGHCTVQITQNCASCDDNDISKTHSQPQSFASFCFCFCQMYLPTGGAVLFTRKLYTSHSADVQPVAMIINVICLPIKTLFLCLLCIQTSLATIFYNKSFAL